MPNQYEQLSYDIAAITESMKVPLVMPADIETAFALVHRASKLWVSEGLAAAETFFDARPYIAPVEEAEDDEPFLEMLETGPGNKHQSDEDEDETEEDTGLSEAELTHGVEVAFEALRADAETLATQAQWQPLVDATNHFFSELNKIADLQDLPYLSTPHIFVQQVEKMLSRPVFTREGFIGVWETIMELHRDHVKR